MGPRRCSTACLLRRRGERDVHEWPAEGKFYVTHGIMRNQ